MSDQSRDQRQDRDELHCAQCGKTRPVNNFTAYFTIPKAERQGYHINHLEICNECLAQPHRPRRLRVLAGLVEPKRGEAEAIAEQVGRDPTIGMNSRQKKEWKKQQKQLRAKRHLPQAPRHAPVTVVAPQLAARAVGAIPVSTPAQAVERQEAADAPRDAYPNVLPVGATFVPAGFEKGKNTGLIIRKDPNDPNMDVEVKCFGHSEIQGQEVYHPHWDFYRDKARPNGLRPSCKELNRVTPAERQNMARTWREEHEEQMAEGRRMAEQEAIEFHKAATAGEQEIELDVDLSNGIPPGLEARLVELIIDPKRLNTALPIHPTFLADARVTLPEGFAKGTGKEDYLDLVANPPNIQEVQRAGLFMLTQMAEVMTSWRELKLLERKYEELKLLAHQAHEQMERAEVVMREIEQARDSFKRQAQEARAELQPTKDALAALQADYEQLKEKASLDHDTLVLTEESNTNLAEQLKQAELLLKPLLGSRSLAQMIAESQVTSDGQF